MRNWAFAERVWRERNGALEEQAGAFSQTLRSRAATVLVSLSILVFQASPPWPLKLLLWYTLTFLAQGSQPFRSLL